MCQVPEIVNVEPGDSLMVKPVSQDEGGALIVEIEDAGQSESSSNEKVEVSEVPPRPAPPIPENVSTKVRIAYNGPEGVFATRVDKLEELTEMIEKLQQVSYTFCPFYMRCTLGDIYTLPLFTFARTSALIALTCLGT